MSFFATFELPPKEGDSTGTAGSAEDLDRLDLLAGAISGECKDDDDEAMGSSGAGFDAAGGGFDPSDLQSAMASLRAEEHEAKGGAGAKGGDEDMGVGGGAGGAAAVAEAKDGPAPVRFDVPMAKGDRPKPESKRELRARVERAKSNSTSTVFLKSTISVPDVDKILLGVSALLSKMIVPCENFDEDPFVQCLPWMTRQKLALQAGGQRAAKLHERGEKEKSARLAGAAAAGSKAGHEGKGGDVDDERLLGDSWSGDDDDDYGEWVDDAAVLAAEAAAAAVEAELQKALALELEMKERGKAVADAGGG